MGVKMMKWRPWPPLVSRKYEVRLIVRRIESFDLMKGSSGFVKLKVEIRWKGPKLVLSSLKRNAVKRDYTNPVEVEDAGDRNGVVVWNEEFQNACNLSAYKENGFHPWEIALTVYDGLNQGPKNKVPVIGTVSVNLAEYASVVDKKDFELKIPLTVLGGAIDPCSPLLSISLSLLELREAQESAEPVQRAVIPVPFLPQPVETALEEKDEFSAIKAGLRKVKIFTGYVSTRRVKKALCEEEGSEGRCSPRSDEGDCNCSTESDSLDDFEEADADEGKEDSCIRKSFSYGKLASAKYAAEPFYSFMGINGDDEAWVYYSNRKSDVGCLQIDNTATSASESSLLQSSKHSILPWKRKLNFRSPKAKGEPLLKKAYGEEGGDDIDFDRRQLSSDESLSSVSHKTEESSANRSSVFDFGDDNFAIGSWEQKELTSRDGRMKLETQVFFASIDQRSERAAGESACTALVAVIADWFQNNHGFMPIKSQFDSLIREGSLEWRNLCENETYKEQFPDKHFDLETVIQAKIRPLLVVPEKSFIGFFLPEGTDEGRFDFLHGAMSFDNIWDEICHASSESPSNVGPDIYIVSWNDHFFVLKVEQDAYYIIDTLGERLYEGCNQAYILKFNKSTVIQRISHAAQSSDEKTTSDLQIVATSAPFDSNNKQGQQANPAEGGSIEGPVKLLNGEQKQDVVCRGKESCKEYIKNFLAAIPIRELQADIRRGLVSSTPLLQRLQIEFHYTQLLQPSSSL